MPGSAQTYGHPPCERHFTKTIIFRMIVMRTYDIEMSGLIIHNQILSADYDECLLFSIRDIKTPFDGQFCPVSLSRLTEPFKESFHDKLNNTLLVMVREKFQYRDEWTFYRKPDMKLSSNVVRELEELMEWGRGTATNIGGICIPSTCAPQDIENLINKGDSIISRS